MGILITQTVLFLLCGGARFLVPRIINALKMDEPEHLRFILWLAYIFIAIGINAVLLLFLPLNVELFCSIALLIICSVFSRDANKKDDIEDEDSTEEEKMTKNAVEVFVENMGKWILLVFISVVLIVKGYHFFTQVKYSAPAAFSISSAQSSTPVVSTKPVEPKEWKFKFFGPKGNSLTVYDSEQISSMGNAVYFSNPKEQFVLQPYVESNIPVDIYLNGNLLKAEVTAQFDLPLEKGKRYALEFRTSNKGSKFILFNVYPKPELEIKLSQSDGQEFTLYHSEQLAMKGNAIVWSKKEGDKFTWKPIIDTETPLDIYLNGSLIGSKVNGEVEIPLEGGKDYVMELRAPNESRFVDLRTYDS